MVWLVDVRQQVQSCARGRRGLAAGRAPWLIPGGRSVSRPWALALVYGVPAWVKLVSLGLLLALGRELRATRHSPNHRSTLANEVSSP